jgi:hypothetical protein
MHDCNISNFNEFPNAKQHLSTINVLNDGKLNDNNYSFIVARQADTATRHHAI